MTRIVRRHSHDVRNYINSLDLEATLLEEVITDPEGIECVARMRAQLRQLEATVKALSVKFAEPQFTSLTAADLFRLWQMQVEPLEDATHRLTWVAPEQPQALTVDPNALVSVLRELVVDAWRRSPGATPTATVKTTDAEVIVELHERIPMHGSAEDSVLEHEHVVTLNGGRLEHLHHVESGEAVTTLRFPATPD